MFVLGNKDLLERKSAVVLNSSQSKTPCGNDAWIKHTAWAIPQLINSGYTLITSTGISTWELAVYLISVSGGNQIIICTVFDGENIENVFERITRDFNLDSQKTAMIFIKHDGRAKSPKESWIERDKAAISLAQKIVPISIRPGGRLQSFLLEDDVKTKAINDFQIEYQKPLVGPRHYDISRVIDFPDWNYLTHWTKTCHSHWPGELRASYYQRLLSSGDSFPNQALNTLNNIISEGKIRASANKMREGRKAIGFTEVNPFQAIKSLMRWRPKHVNWNFEPYGVAIEKDYAISLGIRPVIYGSEPDYKSLSEQDKPYFQSLGKANVDWSREREWRYIGDFDLKKVPTDRILFLAWREQEALLLSSEPFNRARALSVA
jgi:hypothetical protein